MTKPLTSTSAAPKNDDFAPCEPRTGGPAWKAAEAEGHDMTLVASLLRMPLADRLKVHHAALATLNMLRDATVPKDKPAS